MRMRNRLGESGDSRSILRIVCAEGKNECLSEREAVEGLTSNPRTRHESSGLTGKTFTPASFTALLFDLFVIPFHDPRILHLFLHLLELPFVSFQYICVSRTVGQIGCFVGVSRDIE